MISAAVRAVAEKLVDEIAIGRVNLDTIETSFLRAPRPSSELLYHAFDFPGLEGSRCREGLKPLGGKRLTIGSDGRRGDGQRAVGLE